jgi:predicted enzyme related to lactoylglutathione lyase
MIERDGYMAGVPCWVDTTQPDPQAAADFYGQLFGWQFEDVAGADAPGPYIVARLLGGDVAAVTAPPGGAPATAVWNSYVCVESADATAAKVVAAGGGVLSDPFDVADAGRMAVLADTEGAVFCAWEARAFKGAAIVNEPGSVNFNVLNTRDVEGAQAFYGAVFGWESLDLGSGADAWALAGYCDFLEQRDPGLRERMAAMGAPTGFEDVVAGIRRLGDDEAGTPAHWGVTFGVDDADAIAAKAYNLGGRVIVAPVDAPWVRTTVIADPQGAVFTANKFVPQNSGLGAATEAVAGA